jgi:hypothetical protein
MFRQHSDDSHKPERWTVFSYFTGDTKVIGFQAGNKSKGNF